MARSQLYVIYNVMSPQTALDNLTGDVEELDGDEYFEKGIKRYIDKTNKESEEGGG